MKIDVIDGVDKNLTEYDKARLAGFSDKIFVIDIKICNAVQVLIDNIVNYVSATGAITFLRFWGHGAPGYQMLGTTTDVDFDPQDNNAFWTETVNANSTCLGKL